MAADHTDTFDVVCIGAGTVAEALVRGLSHSGLTVAVVESDRVGGECPYWGCMPSKALLWNGHLVAASRPTISPGTTEA